MGEKQKIIEQALSEGRNTLSEYESKRLLHAYDIPVTNEVLVRGYDDFKGAIQKVGFPLVIKACAPDLAHKTEQGLVRVDIRNEEEAQQAYEEIMLKVQGSGGGILVQEMVKGHRELMVGMTRDAQFGPCVMFGLGGIFTEILKDVVFRVAPIERKDALEMTREIKAHKILGEVRGMPPADIDELVRILINVGQMGLDHEPIKEVDINPLILSGSKPIAADALVVLAPPT